MARRGRNLLPGFSWGEGIHPEEYFLIYSSQVFFICFERRGF